MRVSAQSIDKKLRVRAIAGTRAILIALDMDDADRKGLKGFAMRSAEAGKAMQWLTGMKVFKSLAPSTVPQGKAMHFTTDKNPIQSFLWSDYEATPGTIYSFEVSAMFGEPGDLHPQHVATFEIKTEQENDEHHGIWFNRGAIASQAFADKFQNKSLTDADYNDPDNLEVAWLSRGLLEACLNYIDAVPRGDALRVVAYEFTYQRVIDALKKAHLRGVDAQIVYHSTPPNKKAIQIADFPATDADGTAILFERTMPQTPHNKFIVHLTGGKTPKKVWTGSTNFTPSGFLGQTNVGHLVTDDAIAETYFELWNKLKTNPDSNEALTNAMALSPNPANVVETGTTPIFSRRPSDRMLDWYGSRIRDAVTSSMFTGAFSVDPKILGPIAAPGTSMRFILLERPPTKEINAAVAKNPADVSVSFGSILGKMNEKPQIEQEDGTDADGNPTKKWVPIPKFKIEEWFLDEELERRTGDGFVFFIHTKFLLIDPLSDDPLICTGSANFSGASLKSNDENMILIRGDTRVADIYMTEYDRIFRHFYSRDIANSIARRGEVVQFALLDETDGWCNEYFDPKSPKRHRREMFFADTKPNWTTKAAKDPDVFVGEGSRTSRSPQPPPGKAKGKATATLPKARKAEGTKTRPVKTTPKEAKATRTRTKKANATEPKAKKAKVTNARTTRTKATKPKPTKIKATKPKAAKTSTRKAQGTAKARKSKAIKKPKATGIRIGKPKTLKRKR
jgi:phosphatidylserine/phosphatidylglycerophosphate/cardiolipin synthase-like enzyme